MRSSKERIAETATERHGEIKLKNSMWKPRVQQPGVAKPDVWPQWQEGVKLEMFDVVVPRDAIDEGRSRKKCFLCSERFQLSWLGIFIVSRSG